MSNNQSDMPPEFRQYLEVCERIYRRLEREGRLDEIPLPEHSENAVEIEDNEPAKSPDT